MKKIHIILTGLIALTYFGVNTAVAERSPCTRAHLADRTPTPMATVAPGTEFSFAVFDIENDKQISVSIKQKPVEIKTEYKAPSFFVTGKIPDEYRKTAVRISVKINSVHPACRMEDGWLVNISE